MRKLCSFILIILMISTYLFGQNNGGHIRTSLVFQQWKIHEVDDPIFEAAFPIEVYYPVMDNMSLQINHFPALSQFGDYNLAGPSDTWIKASYMFPDQRTMASVGIGLPTGVTELDQSQLTVARLISQQSFKFQVPVFGQGLTLTSGVMYAYPVNDQLSLGAGLNYVMRNKYKFSKDHSEYNPGDQFGVNLGGDYFASEAMRVKLDFVYSYYTSDKLGDLERFKSGPRFLTRLGLHYQLNFGLLWANVLYQSKAKNEIYNDLDQELAVEPKNSNITLRDLDFGLKIPVNEQISLSALGEVRSYVENEYMRGWVDIFGLGALGEFQLLQNLNLFSGFKFFFGDGEFGGLNQNLYGFEFQIGMKWGF